MTSPCPSTWDWGDPRLSLATPHHAHVIDLNKRWELTRSGSASLLSFYSDCSKVFSHGVRKNETRVPSRLTHTLTPLFLKTSRS